MSMGIAYFLAEVANTAVLHKSNVNRVAELNAIATALSSDPTVFDTIKTTAPAGLVPGLWSQGKFINDVLLIVNKGKSGGLTTTAMSNAITAGLSQIFPPVNTAVPGITGTTTVGSTLTCTMGTWTYVPTSYAYQWRRNTVPIAGATASTYVLVAADFGDDHELSLDRHKRRRFGQRSFRIGDHYMKTALYDHLGKTVEATPWTPDTDMTHVITATVVPPRDGDMVVTHPDNADHKWLISAHDFAASYTPLEKSDEEHGLQERERREGQVDGEPGEAAAEVEGASRERLVAEPSP